MNLFLADTIYIVSYRTHGPWRAGIVRDSVLLDTAALTEGPPYANCIPLTRAEIGPRGNPNDNPVEVQAA
jgi:hypothetical protein